MTALALAAVISLATSCIPQANSDARFAHIRNRLVAHAMVESRHDPLAIHDNTTGKSHYPTDITEAKRLLASLDGHSLDVGIAQITRTNWPRLGLHPGNLFNAGVNLCAGAVVLIQDYEAACRYNTGKPSCPAGNTYPAAVDSAMRVIWQGARQTDPPMNIQEVGPKPPPCDAPSFDVWAQQECRDQPTAASSVNRTAIPCDAPSFDTWGQQACRDAAAANWSHKEPTE